MKNRIIYIAALLCVWMVACDNLPDEQFEKYVILTRSGFQERSLDYAVDGIITTDISASVSGTAIIDQDVQVSIKIDEEALAQYNFDKFREDLPLYYTLLPEDTYEMEGKVITIKAGDEYGLLPVKIDLSKLDKLKNYILPVTIISTSNYSVGNPQYTTLLMSVVLKNGFSGVYSGTANMVDNTLKENNKFTFTGSRTFYTIDENTCYFYAGNVSEQATNREKYKVEVKVNSDSTLTLKAMDPSVQLIQAIPDKDKKVNIIIVEKSLTDSRPSVTTVLKLQYQYKDLLNPLFPEDFNSDGDLSKVEYIRGLVN